MRSRLSAIALLAAIIGTSGVSVFAGGRHPVCVAKHHECEKTAKIVNCCFGDQDASRNDSTPVQSRIEIRSDMTAVPALPNIVHVVSAPALVVPVHTSPPRLCLLDLPTLFVTFLI